MSHRTAISGWFAVASVTVLGLTPSISHAQFLSVGTPWGGRVNISRFTAVGFTAYNPITGPVTLRYFNAFPVQSRVVNGYPYGYGSYMSGGLRSAYNTPYYDQRRQELARAQRTGGYYAQLEARSAIQSQWTYERGAIVPAAPENKNLEIPKTANAELLHVEDSDIVSGHALNDLLLAIRPLDEKVSTRVESSLLPPELAVRVRFEGGPTADAVNSLRAGALVYPAPLLTPQFDAMRADLNGNFVLLVEVAGHNRATVTAAADKLTAAVNRARERVVPLMSTMTVSDAMSLARFFNRIASTATTMKNPTTAPAFVPEWAATGVGVRDLTRLMARHAMSFAPASAYDQQEAYRVLYRGLSDYYLNLLRAGK